MTLSSAIRVRARLAGPEALRDLAARFREENLGLIAGSLTFTTLISLVPLVTVMLALFSAFPVFSDLQQALQRWLVQSVVPDVIARPVLNGVTQFAAKASRLGALGLLIFIGTAIALMLTIDRTLNGIWRVRRPRPLAQRVLVYWAAITLGPLVLGASVWAGATAVGASRDWLDDLPSAMASGLAVAIAVLEFGVLAAAFTALYRLVPNAGVRWRHAGLGGVLAATGFLLAKKGLALYLKAVPTFSLVYGAFATVPILLTWIYLVWVIVLLGAVVAAHAPAVLAGLRRLPARPGLQAVLALQVIAELDRARRAGDAGLAVDVLASRLSTDPAQVEAVIDELVTMDWVGRLDEEGTARHVLLCDPATTGIAPWFDGLLLAPGPAVGPLQQALGRQRLRLVDVLPARD